VVSGAPPVVAVLPACAADPPCALGFGFSTSPPHAFSATPNAAARKVITARLPVRAGTNGTSSATRASGGRSALQKGQNSALTRT
jgi:hypothetical protein